MSQKYEKFGYGLFVLKSKNSLFNADFAHEPRQLPDDAGTFYATDKSLKYCIRRYVHDTKGEKFVFFWRRSDKLKPMDLGENYVHLFGPLPTTDIDRPKVESNLLSCWDVRAFGATFAEEGSNISITGPVQITYGINKTPENQKISSQILSPFRNSNEKSEEAAQRTIGSESKALEAHFVFDYIINPKTLKDRNLTIEDITLFKEALCKGASYVNSSAKIGSESEFMLYIESDAHSTMPLLKDLIRIESKDGGAVIDLKKLAAALEHYDIKHIEVYYEPSFVKIENLPHGAKEFNIHTLKPLS